MIRTGFTLVFILPVLILLSGCTNTEQLDQMQAQIAALDHQINRLESRSQRDSKETMTSIDQVSGTVSDIFEQIHRAQGELSERVEDVNKELLATERDLESLRLAVRDNQEQDAQARAQVRDSLLQQMQDLNRSMDELRGRIDEIARQTESNRAASEQALNSLRDQVNQRLLSLDREMSGLYSDIQKAVGIETPSGGGLSDSGETYTVQPGDSLSKISSQLGVSTSALQDLNGITNPNQIRVGQKLKVPK